MKYVFLFCGTTQDQEAWDNMPEEARGQAYEAVNRWFQEYGSRITDGYQLQSPSTATSVRFDNGHKPIVTDGPYLEGNEVIGGYAEIEVADLDEALNMAKSWPAGGVEIRPVVAR